MANARTRARIEARIRERAAYCVEFELNDPRASFITVTRVEITSDLSSAKIFYSVYGSDSDKSRASHMLADASGFVRKQLGRVLRTRRIPQITWFYDDSIEYAAEMQKRIRQALNKDREVNPEAHAELKFKDGDNEEAVIEHEYEDFLDAQDEEEGPGPK